MGEEFDLDAVQREGEDGPGPFPFKFGGESFELAGELDVRVIAALDRGDLDRALRGLLGDDQYERLDSLPAVLDETRFKALLERYAEHRGVTLGESRASRRSSQSTARP